MTPYTIAAIPTSYRGRQYRSRLEARWAAFFDEVGIQAEYEPFDIGKWSPDFLITRGNFSVLVEVKPISTFCEKTAGKMVSACGKIDPFDGYSGLLLLGVQPTAPRDLIGPMRLGWACNFLECGEPPGRPDPVWREGAIGWAPTAHRPNLAATILAGADGDWFPISGLGEPGAFYLTGYPEHAREAWARATNTVQWLGERARP